MTRFRSPELPGRLAVNATVLATVLVAGCSKQANTGSDDSSLRLVPRAVTELREMGIGSIVWTININGSVYRTDLTAGEAETPLTVPLTLLDQPVNEVAISFVLITDGGQRFPLAMARHPVAKPSPGETIRLSGFEYRYMDSDDDTIHDVHELRVQPVDLDNDQVPNVLDTDSDGDSITDGDDDSPFDGAETNNIAEVSRTFTLIEAEGTPSQISVTSSIGPSSARDHLINTLGEIAGAMAAGWPGQPLNSLDVSSGWTAYSLDAGADSLCPEWRIARDASSLRVNLSRPALFFFERNDNDPFIASMANGSVANLDSLDDEINASRGRGAWNDALRLILVPYNTVGWAEVTTEASFSGTSCLLNLTSP